MPIVSTLAKICGLIRYRGTYEVRPSAIPLDVWIVIINSLDGIDVLRLSQVRAVLQKCARLCQALSPRSGITVSPSLTL